MKKLSRLILSLLTVLSLAFPASAAQNEEALWWNILLLGSDERVLTESGRTDTMIILSVNRGTGQIKLTSIMRDTWVHIPDGHGYQKINAAGRYGGPELAMKTVNTCFGTDITQYVLVNMTSLVTAIDLIGGIELDITKGEVTYINRQLAYSSTHEGIADATPLVSGGECIHLNGSQALAYSRIRKLDSDYQRTQRQRNVIMAAGRKAMTLKLPDLLSLAYSMLPAIRTNLTLSDIMTLAVVCLSGDLNAARQLRLPADGTFKGGMVGDTWRIDCNFDRNKKILHDFIYTAGEEVVIPDPDSETIDVSIPDVIDLTQFESDKKELFGEEP